MLPLLRDGALASSLRACEIAESSHKHIHHHQGKVVHSHGHVHDAEHGHGHKSLIVGMVHGMAGSGALLLIVLSTINSIPLGLAYIAIFGAGSIVGMVGISTLIGIPFVKLANSAKVSLLLRYAAANNNACNWRRDDV